MVLVTPLFLARIAQRGDALDVGAQDFFQSIGRAALEFARDDQLAHGVLNAGVGELEQHAIGRVGAQSGEHGGVDLAMAKGEADFEGAAELADGDAIFQADTAEQDSRQIVGGCAEARHAESLAAQFFDPIEFRLRPQAEIRTIGQARHRDDRRAAEAAAMTALAPAMAHWTSPPINAGTITGLDEMKTKLGSTPYLPKAPISLAIHKPTAVGPVVE
jgi:hypothetical protein